LLGGNRTGQHMSQYVIDGGQFDKVWTELAESEFHFDYHDRLFDRREAAKKNKTAYRPYDHT
jgi:hypothetical protein